MRSASNIKMKNVENENSLVELKKYKGKISNTTLLIFSVKVGLLQNSETYSLAQTLALTEGLKKLFLGFLVSSKKDSAPVSAYK